VISLGRYIPVVMRAKRNFRLNYYRETCFTVKVLTQLLSDIVSVIWRIDNQSRLSRAHHYRPRTLLGPACPVDELVTVIQTHTKYTLLVVYVCFTFNIPHYVSVGNENSCDRKSNLVSVFISLKDRTWGSQVIGDSHRISWNSKYYVHTTHALSLKG
jgi:hypothetical protein